jgi:hypothetical protein
MSRSLQSFAELIERTEHVRLEFADELAANARLRADAATMIDRQHELIGELDRIERRAHLAISNSAKRFAPGK